MIILILIVLGALMFFTIICPFMFIKKIKPSEAGVRTGFGGIKVQKDWILWCRFFSSYRSWISL